MWVWSFLAFVATAIITICGIRVYTKVRSTPFYILATLFLAVYIPCSIVVLVPIDLSSSSTDSEPFFYLSEKVRQVLWRVIYWLAFFLTWAVIPMLQGYVDSGYHGTAMKIKDSFHQNARYQLVLLIVGSIGLLYIVLSSGLTFSSIKALAIALSHSYALVIALWLMGHGLINIPRRAWVEADPKVRLKHFYQQATQANDMIAEAQSDYADIAAEVFALAPYKDTRCTTWIESLLETVEAGPGVPFSGSSSTTAVTGRARNQVERSTINEEYLSGLSSRLKTSRNRLVRYDADWQKLLREASRAEDIVLSRETAKLVFRFKSTPLPPSAAYLYYAVVKPYIKRGLAILFAALTIIIVWSEITHGTILSIVNIVESKTNGFWQQSFSMLFLGYMCSCALSSLSRIRIFKVYALVYRHSDPSSMLFYAMYACRLTVPLSFNFITLITSRESVFENFLGQYINLTPLGKYFNDWLPRFILIPMLITTFHVYDRVRDFFGFGLSFDDETDVDDEGRQVSGSVVEGKHLVRRALSDTAYRYVLRHPNIAVASASVAGSYYAAGNSSNSSLLGTARPSQERERPDQRPSRTSLSHVSAALPRQLQLGGRSINRTRFDDHEYSDVSPPNESRAQRRAPVEEVEEQEQETVNDKVKGFFTNLGERFKNIGKKGGDGSDGLLPRWQQRNAPTEPAGSSYRDNSDDDDEDDLPVTL